MDDWDWLKRVTQSLLSGAAQPPRQQRLKHWAGPHCLSRWAPRSALSIRATMSSAEARRAHTHVRACICTQTHTVGFIALCCLDIEGKRGVMGFSCRHGLRGQESLLSARFYYAITTQSPWDTASDYWGVWSFVPGGGERLMLVFCVYIRVDCVPVPMGLVHMGSHSNGFECG